MIIFPEQTHLKIEQISLEKTLVVVIRSTEPQALCTFCNTPSTHIHSRYQRRLSDLPVSGYPAKLIAQVRRFFCKNPSCSHKTFAEAFLPLAGRYAQRTKRLQDALQQLGLSLGGQAGAKIGTRIGLLSSPSSLLRLIRKAELPSPAQPATCIGIDDWAYKRRRRYGTLICDLETGRPLDLLPDRTVQTVSAWFQEHPEIKIISRDRWSEYATAAQKGAPQARQVADRWHLLHNLTQSVATLFPRIRTELNPSGLTSQMNESSSTQKARQQQYQELLAWSEQGLGPEQIAPLVGLSERTVYRWLAHANAPSGQHHTRSSSVIDPYQAYVQKRWQEGCCKGSVLCRELKAQGYGGSERAVYRYLTFLQEQSGSQGVPKGEAPVVLSSKKMTWLLMKEPSTLDEEEKQALWMLRKTSPTAEVVYHLVQDFGQMVRLRQGERLDEWLEKVEASAIGELQSFATGIQRDKDAVQAGLTLPYSNGLLEGHVNRLKLIKRSMYGRARFDLLRLRVLSTA
jgi:transposase